MRQPSTPGSISSGLVSPDYGFPSPYDPNSVTAAPEVNETLAGRCDVPSSPHELPNGSPYIPGQNIFGAMCSPAPAKGSFNPQSVCPIAHVPQAPYQNFSQHQTPSQPLSLQTKCLNIAPHQCIGGPIPAVGQHSPLPVNVMHNTGGPQSPWTDTSGYFGMPVSQPNYPHCANNNSKYFFANVGRITFMALWLMTFVASSW